VAYCSKACQTSSWLTHKSSCKAAGKATLAALKERVARGDTDAIMQLATVTELGQLRVPRSAAEASALRKRILPKSDAEEKLRAGQENLAHCRALCDASPVTAQRNREVRRRLELALPLLRAAVDAGLTEALMPLSTVLGNLGDLAGEAALLSRACDAGVGEALRLAGLDAAWNGETRRACDLYRRATSAGDLFAMSNLAIILQSGSSGIPADPVEAARLYGVVADQPHTSPATKAAAAQAAYNLFALLSVGAQSIIGGFNVLGAVPPTSSLAG
jgi:TPR repeat protein